MSEEMIKELKRQGMTKWAISKKMFVSWQTIHNWDRGKKCSEKYIKELQGLLQERVKENG